MVFHPIRMVSNDREVTPKVLFICPQKEHKGQKQHKPNHSMT